VNVVIVGPFWFPHGSAASARMRNLALGLRDAGARVHVISLAPLPWVRDEAPPATSADYEGISHECVAPTTAAAEGWRDDERTIPRLRRGLADKLRWFGGQYVAALAAYRRLRELVARRQCDLVFVYDRSALRMTPLTRLCRAWGVTSVLDVTELSEHLAWRLSVLYWDFALGTRATPRLFDGLTVITTGLEALYRARGCRRTLVMPAIESWPRAPAPAPTGNREFRLSYVGALQPRDAPELLFEAFRLLSRGPLPVTLDVIGHYEGTPRGEKFAELCGRDEALSRRVHFLGSLSDAALRERLARSDGLLLTRRPERTEELSFPTRLVEYLRGGRPVFVSDVGDVSQYLHHGVDAVLLDPREPARVAGAIAAVAGGADRGAEIGRRGREAGARAFDRKSHAVRLLHFVAGLRDPGVAA
jgi:glycosyltransferase involved in cell wall biosynthesis